jgi:hypothetical protein
MKNANVQESVGDKPPPLATEGELRRIRTPVNQFLRRGIGDRDPCQHHSSEHRKVNSKNRIRNRPAGTAARPRRRHNYLDRVLGDLAALGSLVLNTPLANPLSERERGQLSATLCAFRHWFQ